MRILINRRNEFRMKKDNRVSRSNYRLRLHYSIDNTMLGKRLVYDISLLTRYYDIYNMIDLQAYCNR